ncbi:hypothetical protein Dimus_034797 [Dionaea muscipula]
MLLIKAVAVAVAVAMMVVIGAPAPSEAAVACQTVVQSLVPCLGYVQRGGGQSVPYACCSGIKGLKAAAKNTGDRRSVCTCLKGMLGQAPPFSIGTVSALPAKCGVTLPYQIRTDINCNAIN